MGPPGSVISGPGPFDDLFVPSSAYMVKSGADSGIRDWIILGVLNGLVVALSHLIYSLYIFLGPLAFFIQFFHQSVENLIIANVYLLMPIIAPRRRPFTLNAVVWSAMGMMQGWWPIIPVAVPAGILADMLLRIPYPKNRKTILLLSFSFYSTILSIAGFWPFLFMKQSAMMQRMTAMDPGIAVYIERFSLSFFVSIAAASFITAVAGGYTALRFIKKHLDTDGLQT
jgi:hypothetical protein